MEVRKVFKINIKEIEKLENEINDLIEKANHTSDFRKWQKFSTEIAKRRKELKLIKEFI